MSDLSRRSLLARWPVVLLPFTLESPAGVRQAPPPAPEPTASPGATFPTQDADLVREMVAVSHGNLARVKELIERRPTLAKAAWDWGFGDWESALGAASHMGNREIAELLLANGARPTIFSAAMLGQVDVVRAFVTAMPGIQATKGPHSITLLKHAVAGGERSRSVVDYLTALGGADPRPAEQPLAAEDAAKLSGTYPFGAGATERIEIRFEKERLMFERMGRAARGLFHLGSLVFCPVGAEQVRIRFQEEGAGLLLQVHDPDLVLMARKRA